MIQFSVCNFHWKYINFLGKAASCSGKKALLLSLDRRLKGNVSAAYFCSFLRICTSRVEMDIFKVVSNHCERVICVTETHRVWLYIL